MVTARKSLAGYAHSLCMILLLAVPHTAEALAQASQGHVKVWKRHTVRGRMHVNRSAGLYSQEPISEASRKQIQGVLEVLSDIFESIRASQQKESEDYGAYEKWCSDEDSTLSQALGEARDEGERLEVEIVALESQVASADKELADLSESLERAQNIMAKAASVRGQENDRFSDDMQVNMQSLDQVKQAIKIVGKVQNQGGFLQHGQLEHLQLNEPGESSYVLGILKGIAMKLEQTRKQLQDDEAQKQKEHDLFTGAKREELQSLESERSHKRTMFTETKIQHVDKQRLSKQNTEELAALEKRHRIIIDRCEAKASAFATRQKEYQTEQEAISQAMEEIISSSHITGVGLSQLRQTVRKHLGRQHGRHGTRVAFLQVGMARDAKRATAEIGGRVNRRAGRSDFEVDEADFDADSLNTDGAPSDQGRPGLVAFVAQLARGKMGRSDDAKAMVMKLIARLKEQQTTEEDKFKYCNSEIEKKEKELEDHDNELNEINATITYKQSEVDSIEAQLHGLEEKIDVLSLVSSELRRMRKEEHLEYERIRKDQGLAVKVLQQAIGILEHFYSSLDKTAKTQLVQSGTSATSALSAAPQTWTPGKSTRRTIRGSTAIEMIKKVALEIISQRKEEAREEAAAVAEHEKLQAEILQEHDQIREVTTGHVKRRARLNVQLNTDRDTEQEKLADLDSLVARKFTLHEECDNLLKTFKQRMKARAFEISQLQDVLDILSGSSIAVRTGLLEKGGDAAMGAREVALLREMSQGVRSTPGAGSDKSAVGEGTAVGQRM